MPSTPAPPRKRKRPSRDLLARLEWCETQLRRYKWLHDRIACAESRPEGLGERGEMGRVLSWIADPAAATLEQQPLDDGRSCRAQAGSADRYNGPGFSAGAAAEARYNCSAGQKSGS